MELDDVKVAWKTLDRRLERHNALNLRLYIDGKLDKARAGLRPLFWGQIAQMLFGLLFVLLGVSFWPAHRDVPILLAAGVILHAYGVLTIVMAGITLGHIQRIDYAAPVLEIQKQLARLRRFHVINGMVTGLPWWLLWMLPVLVLAVLSGNAQGQAWVVSFLGTGTAIGIAGLLGTWWFHRWSRHPDRPHLARRLDDSLSGGGIRRFSRVLDEIRQFEKE